MGTNVAQSSLYWPPSNFAGSAAFPHFGRYIRADPLVARRPRPIGAWTAGPTGRRAAASSATAARPSLAGTISRVSGPAGARKPRTLLGEFDGGVSRPCRAPACHHGIDPVGHVSSCSRAGSHRNDIGNARQRAVQPCHTENRVRLRPPGWRFARLLAWTCAGLRLLQLAWLGTRPRGTIRNHGCLARLRNGYVPVR